MTHKLRPYIYITVVLFTLGVSIISCVSVNHSDLNRQADRPSGDDKNITALSNDPLESADKDENRISASPSALHDNNGNSTGHTQPEIPDDSTATVASILQSEEEDAAAPEQKMIIEDDLSLLQDIVTNDEPELIQDKVINASAKPAPEDKAEDAAITIFLSPGHGSRRTANEIGSGGLVYGSSAGNTNEIRNVMIISLKLREKLEAAGYNVVLAREDNSSNPITDERIRMARDAGAAIGISIHSTATLNSCWYQEMGGWRENNHATNSIPGDLGAENTRIVFGGGQLGFDTLVAQRTAELSKQYSTIISRERMAVEGRNVINTSDASGSFSQSRALTTFGNMALEMLLAEDIPWVYSEYGTGTSDNSMTDDQINEYVEGLYSGILAIDFS